MKGLVLTGVLILVFVPLFVLGFAVGELLGGSNDERDLKEYDDWENLR